MVFPTPPTTSKYYGVNIQHCKSASREQQVNMVATWNSRLVLVFSLLMLHKAFASPEISDVAAVFSSGFPGRTIRGQCKPCPIDHHLISYKNCQCAKTWNEPGI
nr:uncharacterized protein LOC123763231 isoform X2 [Procambarus clarkii]